MKKSELFFTSILLPVDLVMFAFSFVVAFYLRGHIEAPFSTEFGLHSYLAYCFYLMPVLIIFSALNGLYSRRNYTGYWQELYRVIVSVSTTILILIVTIFLSKSLFFSRLILVFTWLVAVTMISIGRILLRFIERYLLRFGIGQRRVVIVGDTEITDMVAKDLKGQLRGSYKVIGLIATSSEHTSSHKILGGVDDFAAILKKFQIDEVVLADTQISEKKLVQLIQICEDSQIVFKYVPDIMKMMTLSFEPGLIGSTPVMELKRIPLDGWGRILKRFFDFILALVLVIVLVPLGILLAILVKISSRGPVIYRQERIGRDEKKFVFYKFRSMYSDLSHFKKGDEWTTQENEQRRATFIGRILRKTNLDELPQLWNILIGDMSFVGPRPEQPELVEKFEREIPEYFRRHKVKSGLTGWAQVNGLKGDTSIKERVRYDIYYIENWSLWFDFKIVFKTLGLLIYEIVNGKYEYRTRP